MRRQEQFAGRMASERKDWEIDFDQRWLKAGQSSAEARAKFDKWLQGFRPKAKAEGPEREAQGDLIDAVATGYAGTTNTLLTLAVALLAIWALGVGLSVTAGGLIHLMLLAALGLFTMVWVRRVHYRRPI